MDQTIINLAIALIGALLGFFLKVTWQSVKDLQDADKELADKVASMGTVVAGEYVKRNELSAMTSGIFMKLDRIEDKLDTKADR